jgi:hypothetical protein
LVLNDSAPRRNYLGRELLGTYCGVVENVKDPEKLGRVKVRVPHVFGFIGQNDLPWALPAGTACREQFSGLAVFRICLKWAIRCSCAS